MNAYSQLSDAELVRKVQELMGYSVMERDHPYGCTVFVLCLSGKELPDQDMLSTAAEVWSHAPSPMVDYNVTMGLVDEMWNAGADEKRGDFILVRDAETGKWYCEAPFEYHVTCAECDAIARAICEVYCMVKDSVPSGAER